MRIIVFSKFSKANEVRVLIFQFIDLFRFLRCIAEQHHNEDLASEKEYSISQIEAKIERAEQAIKKMEKKQDYTRERIADLEEMWAEAEEDRVSESAACALVERFDRRGIEPFEFFTSEFGQNSVKIQCILLGNSKKIQDCSTFSKIFAKFRQIFIKL